MTVLQTFLGYPEPDGGVPFALWFPFQTQAVLIAGVINRGMLGFVDLESEQIPTMTHAELLTHMSEHGLQPTNPEETLWWMKHCFDRLKVSPFDEWEIVELLCPHPIAPSFMKVGNGLYNPALAIQTTDIVHPETGAFFPLPEILLAEGVKGVSVVVQNEQEIQQTLLDAVVESCADMAMDENEFPGLRLHWELALGGLSLIYDGQSKTMTRDIAEHNRRAIVMGAIGSQIPFVRVWTMQQLINSVAIAQLMARDQSDEES